MPENEKIKTPEEERFEIFKSGYLEALKDQNISATFKVLLRQKDLILVLGKLKPLTELYFQKEVVEEWERAGLWSDDDLDKLQTLLQEKFKLGIANEYLDGKGAFFRVFDAEQ